MRNLFVLSYLLLGLMLSISLANADDIHSLQANLKKTQITQAQFEQHKYLKGFEQPFISSGTLTIAYVDDASKQTQLRWRQKVPFTLLITLEQEQLTQKVEQQPEQVISLKEQPELHMLFSILSDLLSNDFSHVQKNFAMNLQRLPNNQWNLQLVPTHDFLAKVFQKIELTGETKLDAITLYDRQGDKTLIQFSQHVFRK